MRIWMIGAGYVGLTSGTCLANMGHQVCCYDISAARIAQLERFDIPIYEPGLETAMREAVDAGKLRFSSLLKGGGIMDADAVFIAVGTPSGRDGSIDLSQVMTAAQQIAPHLKRGALVIIKSTVVVGTARRVRELIARERGAFDIRVASNPEFLREGSALKDFLSPDRIVIGADDARARNALRAIYRPFEKTGVPVVTTTTGNAELIKYAANAFLALKIGFVNDVANLCEMAGGDIGDVMHGIGLDGRIGRSFLMPGPGFGGSCFPKDTRAFAATGRQFGAPQKLIETLIDRNEQRKVLLARRILKEAKLVSGSRIAVLGLAFKANTDDVRESAALTLVPILQQAGMQVAVHDPRAASNARRYVSDVKWASNPYDACNGAAAAVILTEWDDYRRLDMARLARSLSGKTLFDYRNLFDPRSVTRYGLRYVSLGRPAAIVHQRAGVSSLDSWDRRVAAPGHA
ncbi:UDP-glucose/GDP-mannose dehydrogenase family protein [Chelativorans sp. Marseille-P2723]|uniref:UDP-glucose dehydrogenase family protein n=1 Tax=Chelativorans sp. Marseille-P2723 TaxID=2709133 RepID=UPI00156F3311|nr:UDP-glucose/GDP-mannose dehydrogenase family protein [Chelativorans sp. Marseille-P2723]